MVAQVDPAFAAFTRAEQVVALIRQNAALEVEVAACGEARDLQKRLEEREQVSESGAVVMLMLCVFYYVYVCAFWVMWKLIDQTLLMTIQIKLCVMSVQCGCVI